MKVAKSIASFRVWRKGLTERVVFVPTMGALHHGHAELFRSARALAGRKGSVVVSLFVNPTQFAPEEDFLSYPRPWRKDLSVCQESAADAVFLPSAEEMYFPDRSITVEESLLSASLCGRSRPGHFRGVCTVVSKLFLVVQPTHAVFGEKDWQQLAIIRRMVRDLNVPVRVVCAPTLRERDGLAMSSRNRRLSAKGRRLAALLNGALVFARWSFLRGERRPARLLAQARLLLRVPGLRIEYLELVRPTDLCPSRKAVRGDTLALAAWVEGVRLIDNLRL